MADFWVNGIVAARDGMPYIQLSNEKGMIGQLSMSQARQIAMDILVMASRTEMDAMVHKWFKEDLKAAPEASSAAMALFRDFRHQLDEDKAERSGGTEKWLVIRSDFGRWIIVREDDRTLAWTGSLWDKHVGGVSIGEAQIANFETEGEAILYATETILRPE